MAFKFTMTLEGGEADKTAVTTGAAITAPSAGTIALYIEDGVDITRRAEIMNGWKKIWNTIRDHNTIQALGAADLYGRCPIDAMRENGISVTGNIALIISGDIAIGLDAALMDVDVGANLMLENSFVALIEAAKERPRWA